MVVVVVVVISCGLFTTKQNPLRWICWNATTEERPLNVCGFVVAEMAWIRGRLAWVAGEKPGHTTPKKKKKSVELDPVYTENAATRKKRLLQAGMEGYGSWVCLHPKRHWHGLFCDCCTHGVLGHVTATPRRKMRQPSLICPFSLHVNIPAFSHVVAGGEFWALVTTAWQGISVARAL